MDDTGEPLLGCSPKTGNDSSTGGDTHPDTQPETFELIGSWQYTVGFAGLTNLLEITDIEMQDSGDYNGTDWTIVFTIVSWDNALDQSRLETASTEGFSHYDVGEPLYMSWRFEGNDLVLYLDDSEFLDPSEGEEGDAYVTCSPRQPSSRSRSPFVPQRS